jgi:thymidylate synthase
MSITGDRYIEASNLSEGWIDALRCALASPDRSLTHLLIRISDPSKEEIAVRSRAQALIDEWNAGHPTGQYYDVETTRNTIFPSSWALRRPEPKDLAAYYRERYSRQGLLGFRNNERGTYFGRIVAYPRGKDQEPGDQLTDTVRKLRREIKSGQPKSSRYEINIYNERVDTNPMSFPCLAHLSVHLGAHAVHLQAIYRSEYLIGRAYGNYMGLAELQCYIAAAAGVKAGELLVTVGHAKLDGRVRSVRRMISELEEEA